jgi:hypothetical protein
MVRRGYAAGIDVTKGRPSMTLTGVVDDHMLSQYRVLLDREDEAFDELEHAYEDGDRDHFEADYNDWMQAVARRLAYLKRLGIEVSI